VIDRADKRRSGVTGTPTIEGSLTSGEPESFQGGPNFDAQNVLGSAGPRRCTLQTSEEGNLSESEDCIVVEVPETCPIRRPKERGIVVKPKVTRSKAYSARLGERATRRTILFRKCKVGKLSK